MKSATGTITIHLPSFIEFSTLKRLFGCPDSVRTIPGLGTSGTSSWRDNFLNTSSDASGINSSMSLSLSELPPHLETSGDAEKPLKHQGKIWRYSFTI